MTRSARVWSIRARTALVFAIAAMILTTGAVVFSNLMSQAGVSHAYAATLLDTDAEPHDWTSATALSLPSASPYPPDDSRAASGTVVRIVATQQWQWSAVGIAGAGLAAGALGWFVSRRMLRPIDRITAAANRITATNLHERVALGGPDDELRRLSRTIDNLLSRLEAAFESQRRFVAQASHELRTPLAVQRAALQIGLPDDAGSDDIRVTREQLLEENRRTEHLVESLLLLAEADRGVAGDVQEIDLDALVTDVITGAHGIARTADVTLTQTQQSSCAPGRLTGQPTLVRQLLINLVGNAIEYNTAGGFVHVTTGDAGFSVENSGPVVPEEIAPLLIEPFRRCPSTSSGGRHSGLGLSIVASIAHAHGWQVSIIARPSGGLRVDVSSI